MAALREKYGFPLFTRNGSVVYLGYERKLIISDIWAFWDYVIKKKNRNKKFLQSLLEQAKNFYVAAEQAPLKSKPLLFYYSFLNLSKIALSFEYGYTDTNDYRHGISERNNQTFRTSDITLQPISRPGRVEVASELYELFYGQTINAKTTINLKDLLSHCVGVHRAYSEIYRIPEIFCKLSEIEYYRNGMTIGFKALIQCSDAELTELQNRGYTTETVEGRHFLKEELLTTRYNPAREDYYNLSQKIINKGIWYYIGNKGHIMYLSTKQDHRYPTEMTIYWTIFYLGSITRYRPNLFDEIFSDTEQWLVGEFLATQPKQFLYLSTAKMLGQKVLKAYSKI